MKFNSLSMDPRIRRSFAEATITRFESDNATYGEASFALGAIGTSRKALESGLHSRLSNAANEKFVNIVREHDQTHLSPVVLFENLGELALGAKILHCDEIKQRILTNSTIADIELSRGSRYENGHIAFTLENGRTIRLNPKTTEMVASTYEPGDISLLTNYRPRQGDSDFGSMIYISQV